MWLREINLGDQTAVGHSGLAGRDRLVVEVGKTVKSVHGCDHSIETDGVAQSRIAHQPQQQRHRVSRAGGLNQDLARRPCRTPDQNSIASSSNRRPPYSKGIRS